MRKNRIIYLALLISVTVLASFFGGTISYALFNMCIGIPIVAFAYNVYVYCRLQFYQTTSSKVVEKGKILPYEVLFRNHDLIPFTHVKVNFYDEQCQVEQSDQVMEYYLLPGDEKKLITTLKCFYRGEYSVGVKQVEIIDFLYLFKMTYPVMWSLKLTVLPTVVKLRNLGILLDDEDPKTYDFGFVENMLLESDTRKYRPGDNPKQIHWKVAAKQGELFTRRESAEIKRNNIIFMDLQKIDEKGFGKLAIEDKILEIVLAIAYYLQDQNINSTICFNEDQFNECTITHPESFGNFYKTTSHILFNDQTPFSLMLERYLVQHPKLDYYILVTHGLTEELCTSIQKAVAYEQQLIVLLVSLECSEKEKESIRQLETLGVRTVVIHPDDDLDQVIG